MGRNLVEDLIIERDALRSGDADALATALAGDRLEEATGRLATAVSVDQLASYRFSKMEVVLLRDADKPQAPPRLGVRVTGVVSLGEAGSPTTPFTGAFALVDGGAAFLITDQIE